MADFMVTKRIRATETRSEGTMSAEGATDLPTYAETNNILPEEDPLFRVSPAIAIDDCYVAELPASEKKN